MSKALKKFEETVKNSGITLERGGKHIKVLKDGRQVGVLATSGETNALRQAMRDLRRQGIVGDAECKVKF